MKHFGSITAPLEAHTLTFANMHKHGALFTNFLRARKETFIDGLGWDLPQHQEMEFDQYDTPMSRYVIVHRGEVPLAGMRLVPTMSRVMVYSYMLKDAQEGRLEGLPDMLDAPAPTREDTWEASRVLIRNDPTGANTSRARVRSIMLCEMLHAASDAEVDKIICILPGWWPMMKRMGCTVRAIGPKTDIDGPHQAVEIDVKSSPLLQKSPVALSAGV